MSQVTFVWRGRQHQTPVRALQLYRTVQPHVLRSADHVRGPHSCDELRAIIESDHEWPENISALLHAAGVAEDDQASRLRACALPGSYTIGLEVLLDGEHAADITPSHVSTSLSAITMYTRLAPHAPLLAILRANPWARFHGCTTFSGGGHTRNAAARRL